MSEKKYLPTYKGCIVCGNKDINPNTMGLRFEINDDGVQTKLTPDYLREGYKNIVHGGITCSLLDETIGWSVAVERKKFFVTGELNVRFVRPLPTNMEIIVKGHTVEHKSRYSIAEGEIIDNEGTVYAKATGKFFLMKDDAAQAVNNYLTFQEDDLDVLAKDH
jgi:uncharacterized protein (TIGR00369 family)